VVKIKNRILSWPGTKFRQIDDILNIIKTDNYNTICEPYLGGAAFSLQQDSNKKFFWAEKNKDLYNWWRNLLYKTEDLIERMQYFKDLYKDASQDKEVFLQMREDYNFRKISNPQKTETSALLWVLIYQSTNNLARFNKKGGYNQTWGKGRKVPDISSYFNNEVIQYFKNISYNTCLYNKAEDVLNDVLKLDNKDVLVYLDPPYLLRTEVYDKTWNIDEEKKMFEYIDKLENQGIAWFMTNYLSIESKTGKKEHPFLDTIYKWSIFPLDRKKDARPTTSGNKANEFIIVGSHYAV